MLIVPTADDVPPPALRQPACTVTLFTSLLSVTFSESSPPCLKEQTHDSLFPEPASVFLTAFIHLLIPLTLHYVFNIVFDHLCSPIRMSAL